MVPPTSSSRRTRGDLHLGKSRQRISAHKTISSADKKSMGVMVARGEISIQLILVDLSTQSRNVSLLAK